VGTCTGCIAERLPEYHSFSAVALFVQAMRNLPRPNSNPAT